MRAVLRLNNPRARTGKLREVLRGETCKRQRTLSSFCEQHRSAEDGSKRGLYGLRIWNMVGSSIRIADVMRGWLGRKGAVDQLPFCGSATGAVDGCLYMLGGFYKASALRCV
ncbi:unnamed protein product [Ilex paraguariensis]|uniref:Uncharacterized protein n=1 Tax=Ilex paraguariensis TaxID=185542 RepID=A0ABC8R7V0_9AQUA